MARLSSLDRRLLPGLAPFLRAQRGPFRVLAELPQLGFVILGALICVALAVVGQRLGDTRQAAADANRHGGPPAGPAAAATAPTAEQAIPSVLPDPVVGPVAGTTLADYVPPRLQELRSRAVAAPDAPALAVVSLSAYVPASAVPDLLGAGVRVEAVLVHVPVAVAGKRSPTPAGVVAVPGDPASALRTGLGRLADDLDRQARDNQGQADSITTIYNPSVQAQKDAFVQEAKVQRLEVATLRGGGPSVYAVLASGPTRALAAVVTRPRVRLVDLGAEGLVVADAEPHGLLPEDATAVSALERFDGLGAP